MANVEDEAIEQMKFSRTQILQMRKERDERVAACRKVR